MRRVPTTDDDDDDTRAFIRRVLANVKYLIRNRIETRPLSVRGQQRTRSLWIKKTFYDEHWTRMIIVSARKKRGKKTPRAPVKSPRPSTTGRTVASDYLSRNRRPTTDCETFVIRKPFDFNGDWWFYFTSPPALSIAAHKNDSCKLLDVASVYTRKTIIALWKLYSDINQKYTRIIF